METFFIPKVSNGYFLRFNDNLLILRTKKETLLTENVSVLVFPKQCFLIRPWQVISRTIQIRFAGCVNTTIFPTHDFSEPGTARLKIINKNCLKITILARQFSNT
jgi:hypothetical protein